jgi:hypothetical protein
MNSFCGPGLSHQRRFQTSNYPVLQLCLLLLDRHLHDLAGECVGILFIIRRDIRLGVETYVRAFIPGESEWLRLGDLRFGDLLTIDTED